MRKSRNQTVRNPQETHSLLKRIKQTSVVLSDLDGLLVNSENFNQVFVHRTSKAWMQSTISRVVKSDLHLQKFIQVLIKFIVTERHPEWARHALVWLRFLLSNFSIPRSKWSVLKHVVAPLLNQANEMAGLHDLYVRAALRGSAVERWNMRTQKLLGKNGILSSTGLFFDQNDKIPSTGYVFVDDSDEDESSVKRRARSRQQFRSDALPPEHDMETEEGDVLDEEGEGSVLLGNDSDDDEASVDEDDPSWDDSDQDEDESEDQLDPLAATPSDSDHGVFDVNDTASFSSGDREADYDDDYDDDEEEEQEEEEEEEEDNADGGEPSRPRSEADNSNQHSSDSSSVSDSETDEETKFLLLGRQINADQEESANLSHAEIQPKRASKQSVRRAKPRKKQRTGVK